MNIIARTGDAEIEHLTVKIVGGCPPSNTGHYHGGGFNVTPRQDSSGAGGSGQTYDYCKVLVVGSLAGLVGYPTYV